MASHALARRDAWFESPDRCCVRLCPKGRAKHGREHMPPAAATAACPGAATRTNKGG
jgi:hypothetical protein